MSKPKILFLCTGNSCRSQMAEGWGNALYSHVYDIYSAGIEAHGMNPKAMAVMLEAGIDISHHQSQRLEELDVQHFDFIFAVCGHACSNLPAFASGHVILQQFDDPPKLSASARTEEEALDVYRRVRDEIKEWIEQSLPEHIARHAEQLVGA